MIAMRAMLCTLTLACFAPVAQAQGTVTFKKNDGRLSIFVGGRPFATYVWNDPAITRPFFCDIHTGGGQQVTRNHPPVAGHDSLDHDTYHPGLWLAFGDLSGADFWRNKARVEHAEFAVEPTAHGNEGTFTVVNLYKEGDKTLCKERCKITVVAQEGSILIVWASTFESDSSFTFGDQEEMGLGVRVATPLTVEKGGAIVNANAQINEQQAWGKAAAWCTYSGVVEGRPVGITLMPDPSNFRPSWFHVRDYGLMVANPFGRNAMTKGDVSQVVAKSGEPFRLRFGVSIHDGFADPNELYKDWVKRIEAR